MTSDGNSIFRVMENLLSYGLLREAAHNIAAQAMSEQSKNELQNQRIAAVLAAWSGAKFSYFHHLH